MRFRFIRGRPALVVPLVVALPTACGGTSTGTTGGGLLRGQGTNLRGTWYWATVMSP
jgi:hypothetical protein